jgi:hypothetical protein
MNVSHGKHKLNINKYKYKYDLFLLRIDCYTFRQQKNIVWYNTCAHCAVFSFSDQCTGGEGAVAN